MIRRPANFELAAPAALLLALVAASTAIGEETTLPLLRSGARSSVYLAPSELPTLPGSIRQIPAPTASRRLSQTGAIRTAQAGDDPLAPQGGLVAPSRKSIIADSAETDRRVDRLKRQLEELHDQLSRPPVDPPVIERIIVTPPFQNTSAAPTPVHEHPPVVPAPPEAGITPGPAPGHEEPAPAAIPSRNSQLTASGLIKGLPVAAIDRVYVADNLFAAGEYVLAAEIYSQVDRKSISEDESGWVEFQTANCCRRQGKLEEARKRYRRVVSDPTLGWLQDMAKWRLDAIDDRELLVKEHARLDAAIKQLSEVAHAPAAK